MSIVTGFVGSIVSTRRMYGPLGSAIFVRVRPGAIVWVVEVRRVCCAAVAATGVAETAVTVASPTIALRAPVNLIPRMD